MSSRLVTSRPVPGSCRNRYRRLRRDHGGDILAGILGLRAPRIELNRRSAEEALRLLQESGAELLLVRGINNRSGIDPNPGYTQILAVDSEGNLVNFSEYLEY